MNKIRGNITGRCRKNFLFFIIIFLVGLSTACAEVFPTNSTFFYKTNQNNQAWEPPIELQNIFTINESLNFGGIYPDADIVVPDDFLKIQDAIYYANAEHGYRIFVRSSEYYENLKIDKDGIILIGEDKNNTIIHGDNKENVLELLSHNIVVSNFMISNSGNDCAGILISSSNGNIIKNNIICNNFIGISLADNDHFNNLSENTILDNSKYGIFINHQSTENEIFKNEIRNNALGGITLQNTSRSNYIKNNKILSNKNGILINSYSDGNILFLNTLLNNQINAFDTSTNTWDNGAIGNYWSDYDGSDTDSNGIGDSPYFIEGGNNQDRFPLMIQPSKEPSSLSLLYKNGICPNDMKEIRTTHYPVGDTIVVPDDYPTIGEAIDHALDGDTILIKTGIYHEHLIVNKSINIMSGGGGFPIIDGDGYPETIFKIVADGVTLLGLEITNCSNGFSGARVYGSNCVIQGNSINKCGGGVEIWNTNNITVLENLIEQNIWGMYVHGSSDIDISYNQIFNNYYGIEVGHSQIKLFKNSIDNNTQIGLLAIYLIHSILEFNDFSYNYDSGIQFFSSDFNELLQNEFKEGKNGIQIRESNDNHIAQNFIHENKYDGLALFFNSKNNTIYENEIHVNRDGGIKLYLSSYNKIHNNNISDLQHYSLATYDSHSNEIIKNSILNNDIGMVFLNSDNNNIQQNQIRNLSVYGIYNEHSKNNSIDNNNISESFFSVIVLFSCSNISVINNSISIVGMGSSIQAFFSDCGIIAFNTIETAFGGISLINSISFLVSNNKINDSLFGITLTNSTSFSISHNKINNSWFGIYLKNTTLSSLYINEIKNSNFTSIYIKDSSKNIIKGNTLINNSAGVEILNDKFRSTNNYFYHNNFIKNQQQINSADNFSLQMNIWFCPLLTQGNYWDDYNGKDDNEDGIGDTPYHGLDAYPFMNQCVSINGPPIEPSIQGVNKSRTRTDYHINISTIDPENEKIFYYIDWADGTTIEWIGPYPSGNLINVKHTYTRDGTYAIKIKSKDTDGLESNWSCLEVSIPKQRKYGYDIFNFVYQLKNCNSIQFVNLVMKIIRGGNT